MGKDEGKLRFSLDNPVKDSHPHHQSFIFLKP